MKSNQEIVETVYRTYGLRKLIIKMVSASVYDKSHDDLEQIIYMQLMIMKNQRLNQLFKDKKLPNFITGMIKNIRAYYLNDYKRATIKEHSEPTEEELLTFSHQYELDWLDDILNNYYQWDKLKTKEEIYIAGCFEMIKFYLSSNYSMKKISTQFDCSPTKINNMIKDAKKEIERLYYETYEIWLETELKKFE